MAQGEEARARRVQRRDEVKARLGTAMLTVARDRPYSAITVEHIASAAGISRSTFYFYYRDKAELLIDSAREVVERMFSQSDEYLHGSGEPRSALREALARNVSTFRSHGAPAGDDGGLNLRRAGRGVLARQRRCIRGGPWLPG